ncbi:hypothetical protein [Brevibacillus reuszeri]|uniref:hypothetical protein n=1 Tax=Brevibacillus reuszeri TaxID=54915 RepID=UPI000CCBDA87|nr:hypothetical protein [Brevibacillus reuszeri]
MMDLTARMRLIDNITSPLRRASDQVRRTSRILDEMGGSMAKTAQVQDLVGKSAAALTKSFVKVDGAADLAKRTVTSFQDSTGNLRSEFGRFSTSGKHAGGAFDGIAGAAIKAKGAVIGLKSAMGGVIGIAAGYGIYRGAESFLESSIGGAAQHELATVQIEALFQDMKKAKTYMDRMSAAAAASPILNEQQVFQNSKSFLALTKQQDVLEDLWKGAEKLNAMDPAQGLEGAVLAMRELAGGDVQSMVERFELPRSVVNKWKNLPIDKQAKALNKYMDSIGFNQQFLEKTGATAAKQWDRTTELFQKGARVIGQDSLAKLKPVLVDINDFLSSPRFDVFVDKAGTAMAGLFDGLIDSAKGTWNYLDSHYFSNAEFASLPDITAKVDFIINDLTKSFTEWYDRTGSDQLEMATGRVTKTILEGLERVAPDIGKSAASIGARIAISMTSGFLDEMKGNFVGQALLHGMPSLNAVAATKDEIGEGYKKLYDYFTQEEKGQTVVYGPPAPGNNHYHGIEYVPRDGYNARLHKGERVLTAQENRHFSGSGGSAQVVNISMNGVTIREEADVELIAYRLAQALNKVN